MEIRDSEMSLVFFILYICKMKKIMKEKNQVVPDEVLSKREFDIRKPLKKFWEWNIFSTFIVDNQ